MQKAKEAEAAANESTKGAAAEQDAVDAKAAAKKLKKPSAAEPESEIDLDAECSKIAKVYT